MKRSIFYITFFLIFFSNATYAFDRYVDADAIVFQKTPDSITLNELSVNQFRRLNQIPELLERDTESAIWIKFPLRVSEKSLLIFDFIRMDKVNFYLYRGDSLINESQTGYMMKSRDKKMNFWNAIDLKLEADINYTVILRVEFFKNEPSTDFHIKPRDEWRLGLLNGIIIDVVFLAIVFFIALYSLLIYFQNREKAYLHFSGYLLTIFCFYIYILEILRDFVVRENPTVTLFFVLPVLLTPAFFFFFMKYFNNARTVMPEYVRSMRVVGKANFVIFFIVSAYFLFTINYYVMTDIVRFIVLINLGFGCFYTFLLWQRRNSLINYFIAGTIVMMAGVLLDVVFWLSPEDLGRFARVGFVGQIILFTLGLGKKGQLAERDKNFAQKSYIDQLQINEKLMTGQQLKLEEEVAEQTKGLKAAKEEAELNAKAKEHFLSVMSHEIRTPMNAIVGLTHMLTSQDHQDEFDENLTTLRYSVDNLMLLVNNILDYNKISGGNVQLEHVPFNLKKIVLGVCHLFKAKADSKGLVFDCNIAESVPEYLIGDPFRLSQILNNLLSNAIKFTEKGSIKLSILLNQTEKGFHSLYFEISDSGVGIPVEKQHLIFKSFSQAETDTTRKYGGTGLGLAISKDLIELMKGEIQLESSQSGGAKFSFNVSFEGTGDDFIKDSLEELSSSKSVNLEDLSVLIVDDNEMNRIILRKFLDRWEVRSQLAINGKEAMKTLKSDRFDIVLLDLQMPEMDGYEVAKAMTADPQLKHIPIIAISADTISNVYDKVAGAGMDDFIAKPFNPDELKAKIYTLTAKVKLG